MYIYIYIYTHLLSEISNMLLGKLEGIEKFINANHTICSVNLVYGV